MSTEYYVIAEKDDDLVIFDHLYKGKRTLLAMASNQNINDIIENYDNDKDEFESLEQSDVVRHDAHLLLKLINFIYTHQGYTFNIMTDNSLIDYLNTKYDDWSWDKLKYYEPRL